MLRPVDVTGAFLALIDNQQSALRFPNAPAPQTMPALPLAALERLSSLHAENSQAARLANFLASAVDAAGALVLLGTVALAFATSTSLPACFAWSLLVLMGIGALLRSYIRSTATAIDPAPMEKAAKSLRIIAGYAGVAWGTGAFLVLSPTSPVIAMVLFAGLPSLSLSLLFKDRDAALAFLLPVTALCIAVPVWSDWPDAGLDTWLLLMLQSGLAAHAILRSRNEAIQTGLALH